MEAQPLAPQLLGPSLQVPESPELAPCQLQPAADEILRALQVPEQARQVL